MSTTPPGPDPLILLYVTVGQTDEAKMIARTLLQERLCACANISAPVTAIYEWGGAVVEGGEVVLLMKTRSSLAARAAARTRALHSYEVPCILQLAISATEPDFHAWVLAQTPDDS